MHLYNDVQVHLWATACGHCRDFGISKRPQFTSMSILLVEMERAFMLLRQFSVWVRPPQPNLPLPAHREPAPAEWLATLMTIFLSKSVLVFTKWHRGRILRLRRRDCVPSVELRRRLCLTSTPALLVQRRVRWFSHAARRPEDELIKDFLLQTPARTWQMS